MNNHKKIAEMNERLESVEKALFEILKIVSDTLNRNHESIAELEERVAGIEEDLGKF
jgi:archaellum component FlaC